MNIFTTVINIISRTRSFFDLEFSDLLSKGVHFCCETDIGRITNSITKYSAGEGLFYNLFSLFFPLIVTKDFDCIKELLLVALLECNCKD